MEKFEVYTYVSTRKTVIVEAESKEEAVKQGFLLIMADDASVVSVPSSSFTVDANKLYV